MSRSKRTPADGMRVRFQREDDEDDMPLTPRRIQEELDEAAEIARYTPIDPIEE